MILISYEATNWGPHQHIKLEFPRGAKTIAICAPNDEGKSWAVRGIAFCLSIGRNEYGDQTSIHDGEAESKQRLVIEHKGLEHTIEKIVRGKKSDEEGTTTIINGKPTDRAGYERFYREILGLPHPSIWLPITVAMQNETDFHLRRKKSEREEPLRAACQLTPIDSWKEALQLRTNTEDKTLLAEEASHKARAATLGKDLTDLSKEKASLEKTLQECQHPLGENEPSLEEILKTVTEFEATNVALKRAELEKENQQRELTLAQTGVSRLQADLAKTAGASPEEEAKTAQWLENLQEEAEAREKKNLAEKLSDRLKASAKKQRELEKVKECLVSPETIAEIERLCKEIAGRTLLAEEKEKEYKEALKGEPAPDNWETEAEAANIASVNLTKKADALTDAGKSYTTAIKDAATLFPQIGETKFPDLVKAEEFIQHKLEEAAEFGHGPLGAPESRTIIQRVLAHWEEHPHDTCPVCDRSMEGLPSFQNPKTRKVLLESLKGEIQNKAEMDDTRRKGTLALHALDTAKQFQKKLQELEPENWENWSEKAEKYRKDGQLAEAKSKTLVQAQVCLNTAKTHRDAITTLNNTLANTHPETKTTEKATEVLKTLRETTNKKVVLEAELVSLEREAAHFEESCTRLEKAGAPSTSPEISSLIDDNFKKALEDAKTKVRTLRENRNARAELEKNLTTANAKLEAILKNCTATQTETDRLTEKLKSACGMPEAKPDDQPSERATHWRTLAKKEADTKALLVPLPQKIIAKTEELGEALEGLEATAKAAAKAAAARRLVAFLDYKNAPRKLLTSICERLFDATNRLAETLDAEIRVKVGKNLDFLTIQKRGGRIIEQKTERLGFGKGAVLGICFRMACQKILQPDTGFLILDEPTANVDTKRKDALKIFLQNLGEEKESKTQQVILIEHDQNVTELCQAKIFIGENTQPTKDPAGNNTN